MFEVFLVFLSVWNVLWIDVQPKTLAVDIAILGTYHPSITASLSYQRPSFDLAVADVNAELAGKIIFNLKYLNVTLDLLCQALVEDSDFLLSKWYYEYKRPASEATTLLFPVGTVEPDLTILRLKLKRKHDKVADIISLTSGCSNHLKLKDLARE